jgi:hypothetical protein
MAHMEVMTNINNDDELTTISLKRKTRKRLADIGGMDDSFDDLLNRLADFWTRYKGVVERRR